MLFSPMKKFLTAFVVVVFSAVSLSPVHSVPVEDEQWPSQFSSETPLHGFELNEVSGLRDNVSVLTHRHREQRAWTTTVRAVLR